MFPNFSALPIGGPAKRARGPFAPVVVKHIDNEFLFGYFRALGGDEGDSEMENYAMNRYGEHTTQLPMRQEVLKQLEGTHPKFNFRSQCDWDGALSNFVEYVAGYKAFAILATREKEVVGMFSIEKDTEFTLEEWCARVRAGWAQHAGHVDMFAQSNQRMAATARNRHYVFAVDYACTGGGLYSDHPDRVRGIMRYMLYCMSYIIDQFYVKPVATMAYMDQWDMTIPNRQACVDRVRRMCYFTLRSVSAAEPVWKKLGFSELYQGGSTFFKPVFAADGSIPPVPNPESTPPNTPTSSSP